MVALAGYAIAIALHLVVAWRAHTPLWLANATPLNWILQAGAFGLALFDLACDPVAQDRTQVGGEAGGRRDRTSQTPGGAPDGTRRRCHGAGRERRVTAGVAPERVARPAIPAEGRPARRRKVRQATAGRVPWACKRHW